ncbi:MAG TPA: DUF4058 family protein [Tepidisphaeraceae bacterium]|nr:DUF4058 family protein [Tepidisphaeraceae bacterium]
MKSPFPGMDPYLERHWRDVHTALIAYARDQLNERLPDDLIARAEERMMVEVESHSERNISRRRTVSPDVRIFGVVEDMAAATATSGGVALAPFRLAALAEPAVERFIEIIDVSGGERIVTVIEFISPTNKGDGISTFVEKRDELLAGGVNFVEIDLVREGDWRRLLGQPCPVKAESTFRAAIRVPGTPPAVYLHPFPLRQPLPPIKIPLRDSEMPCELALQPLVDQAYRNGRYDRTIDYDRPCEPPLEDDDAVWAKGLITSPK